ncbi:DNA-binding MarR family transcriptional regulator [Streptomyces aurantiacus]|uniref:MarR family winged helix-turn-helix transcriptional regulator n=1 Tax=Streptomyces aurantiacus TaxID=47760 RepID=UPI002794C456|nr:MarR family transcriptional regulator [Streptomyces aurantiacus]MDQ0777627.1 DNA-binding MarR family transcriptional regulator [Streptomyces aurantiacus]
MPDMDGESLTYQLLRLVHAMDDATNTGIQDVMAELGLTHALADALWQLDPTAPAPSMRQMAARLHCDPSTVTFLADRLEQLSYVHRAPAPGDRRTKALHLTEQGHLARRQLVDAAMKHTPIAQLTVTEQRRLHRLLTKAMTGGRKVTLPHEVLDAPPENPEQSA